MAQLTFNVSLGREVEFYERVYTGDPANCGLVLVVLAAAGIEDDSTLKQYDTLAALLAGASAEVTNTGYTRFVLVGTMLDAYTIDDIYGRITLPFPTQTTAAIGIGDLWRKLLICYDPDTTIGTSDVDVIPVTAHDLLDNGVAATPNGSAIIISGSDGFLVAS